MLNESEHKVYLSRYTQKVDLYIKRPPTGETFITTRTYSIDPFTVLTTIFDWDKLAKIRYHGRKESVKISYVAKIESEDKAPRSGRII